MDGPLAERYFVNTRHPLVGCLDRKAVSAEVLQKAMQIELEFLNLAERLDEVTPDNSEKEAMLRHLVQSFDSYIRAIVIG